MSPTIIALGAVARRFVIALVTGVIAVALPYLSEAWRPALEDALKNSTLPAVLAGAIWLIVEFTQKLWRERKKARGVF